MAALCLSTTLLPARAQTRAQAANDGDCRIANWPQYRVFLKHFVQHDGRVLDASTPKLHSSSEGQSYGMFFALVANDAASFEKIWRWAVNNLAKGDVGSNLPAWLWGLNDRNQWTVIDPNPASDAELWFIYSLLEAGKRWQRADYLRDAAALLALVEAHEVDDLPGLGKMLLPWPRHLVREDRIWRLNPSYHPLFLLRRLAAESPHGPWRDIISNTVRMLRTVSPKGFAPDWVGYQADGAGKGRFVLDPEKQDIGSYDAIRVYLWAGLTAPEDPLAPTIANMLHGMADATRNIAAPPEIVHTMTGLTENTGPFGFSAALVPYFHLRKETDLMQAQYSRAIALWQASLDGKPEENRQPPYYDHMLCLFSTGWQQGHYRFLPNGSLQLPSETPCPHATTR